jgi:hypothetical protein
MVKKLSLIVDLKAKLGTNGGELREEVLRAKNECF